MGKRMGTGAVHERRMGRSMLMVMREMQQRRGV